MNFLERPGCARPCRGRFERPSAALDWPVGVPWLAACVVKALVAIESAPVGFDFRQVAGHPVEASTDRVEPAIDAIVAVLTGTE
jgi:hypothetical protein